MQQSVNLNFWYRWMCIACFSITAFGVMMVFFPYYTLQVFSLILYGTPTVLLQLESTSQQYIQLLHAITGAVMISWSVSLYFILHHLFKKQHQSAWYAVFLVVAAWYIPDTTLSLVYGFWQNAILNSAIMIMFLIPLVATRRCF